MSNASSGRALEFDIVVYGGSFSAPAAALAAARTNPGAKVLLLEPTDWLGGQATTQGVSAIDNAWHEPARSLMANEPEKHYPSDYLDWLKRMTPPLPAGSPGAGLSARGTCWVSRESFDPRTGAWALEQMVAGQPSITLMKMAVVKRVATEPVRDEWGDGRRVTALTVIERRPVGGYVPHSKFLSQEMPDWYSATDSTDFSKTVYTVVPRDSARGLVVIEASETADVMVLSGAEYTVGRELMTEQPGPGGAPPACDEDGSQAIVYTFCMTGAAAPDEEKDLSGLFPGFDAYLKAQTDGYFSLGIHTWPSVWTYRRLKADATTTDSTVSPGDVSMQNWYPGNDYPYASWLKNREAARAETADWRGGVNLPALAEAEKHAVAWHFWMKERKPVAWDVRLARGGDPDNMMGTAHGLAKFPYIRCTRRGIGLNGFRMTSAELVDTELPGTPKTSFRYYDSVGIGCYAVDIHPTKKSDGISPDFERAAPYYIPYRALASRNVRNLLLTGKTLAGTYLTNAAYRLHPQEWAIGTAAGTAAAQMAQSGAANCALLETAKLRALQGEVARTAPIHWPAFDRESVPARAGDLVVNGFLPVEAGKPFGAAVHHHGGTRARLLLGGAVIGESTRREGDRILLEGLTAPAGATGFVAEVLDADGKVVDAIPQDGGDARRH